MSQHLDTLKICDQNNGRHLTAAEKQLQQRKHCKKHCSLVVSLEKEVIREGSCQGNRKLRADPV